MTQIIIVLETVLIEILNSVKSTKSGEACAVNEKLHVHIHRARNGRRDSITIICISEIVGCSMKRTLAETQTQIRRRKTRRLIRICIICASK